MKINGKPVQVIAWFTESGKLKPIRFKILNEDSSYSVVKINRVLYSNIEKYAGNYMIMYRCQSIILGAIKPYILKYDIQNCRWIFLSKQ